MKSEYDVLIIGGGPGGALAAKTAAEKGLSVALAEKRPAIGAPVRCAEGIGEDLICEFFDEIDPKWISAKIEGAKLIAPDGSYFYLNPEMAGNEVGFVLDRKFFDRDLIWQAVHAGAEIFVKARAVGAIVENGVVCGAKIEYNGEVREVRAKITIAADGVESKFTRWCGIDTTVPLREMETCAQYLMTDINIEPNITVFHVGREIAPEGYLWIFPKGHRSANVGIGISGTQSGDGQRAKDYLDRYVSENFPEGKIIEQIAGGVSVCEPLECTVSDGLMIIGDAARISDPMTGGGIYNAMYTGRLAAEVASKCIESGDLSKEALMEYDSVWRDSKMGRALERNYQMKEIFVKLTDKQLNAILTSVKNLKMADFSTLSLVKEIVKLNPKLIKDLTGLKKYFE
ncbi:NAD(P)/FAD-dependent oxidoreductase [Methanoplanus limicola]|uniref:Digeranylgeranylglycerophospholipid reductase n=1 Tax=Methanoplanus limicola DSM 2279 TaxID=937775 RepID=H1YX47_9EURY|nr:NAD(P)/FAD-dependent oxidoreductase [Methanoplanus limicola]EHQ35850.1 2,3-di-O-geranylgeranylglyceryl phosphate reductase [Methanoplanus limicola DSM 2279]